MKIPWSPGGRLKEIGLSYAMALHCRKCGREYPFESLNLCDFCFSPQDTSYDYKSIAVGNPADGYYALRAARQSGGGACAAAD
jgi:hypothetical protein